MERVRRWCCERERGSKVDPMALTNRECARVLILEPSLLRINVFASNTFLLRFILPLPCRDSLFLYLFVLISPLSLSSRAPPRDNNYPFEALARGVAKVTIFLLATSPYAGYVRDWVSRGILQSIIHTSLFLSCHARSTVDLPWCIISAGLLINS